jgi:hypothetical protein
LLLAFPALLLLLPLRLTAQEFQEPTLRPKLFALNGAEPLPLQKHRYLEYGLVRGRTADEALLLGFNPLSPLASKVATRILAEIDAIYPAGPTKTVLAIGVESHLVG